jgi:hypothetical protein
MAITAVGGAPQRGDAGGNAGERIGATGAGDAHRRGRGILLVVGVQDEQPIQRLGQHRADFVLLARRGEHHVEEVLGVVHGVARIDERLALRILVGVGGDGRHLGDQPVRRNQPVLGLREVHVVVIEGRQRPHHAAHDRHRMGISAETAEEELHLFVQHGVVGDRVFELFLLLGVRQFAVDDQIGHFQEVRMLGQLLDGIAPVFQDAGFTVDIGDGRGAASGRTVARIVGEQAGVGVELADVDDLGADRSLEDGIGEPLPVAVVDHRHRVLARWRFGSPGLRGDCLLSH